MKAYPVKDCNGCPNFRDHGFLNKGSCSKIRTSVIERNQFSSIHPDCPLEDYKPNQEVKP
jgi:hypothetical protein